MPSQPARIPSTPKCCASFNICKISKHVCTRWKRKWQPVITPKHCSKNMDSMQIAFEHAGGYDCDLRIRRTLQGLGLDEQHWEMPLSHLSGGQKTRALLARLLLEKPDLLMLDEPTNHLDTEAIEWLEHTLAAWEGAVLVASHDRFFLDNAVDTIWEMSRTGIEYLFR